MNGKNAFDIINKKVLVVYKHSRFSYALEQSANEKHGTIFNNNDPLTKSLLLAHEKNLRCIDHVASVLKDLGIPHSIICRSDILQGDIDDSFIICVGGDGTLLDTSHYCTDSPILGVNSDPNSSIGALCAAHQLNFRNVLEEIYHHALTPIPLLRLLIKIDDTLCEPLALNDVLYCHKNPAAMSRFSLEFKGQHEVHRGSGIWVATPAGSTGGIFSSGGKPLPLAQKNAIFRMREPYWAESVEPHLLQGELGHTDKLFIRCHMSDSAIFIDGPHMTRDVELGQTIEVSIADQPLWLFDGKRLEENRKRIIKNRRAIKYLL